MAKGSSLWGRALLAVALMIGFYLLALAISAGLVYIPVAEYQLRGRVHGRLALVCIAGAAIILWSVLPRRDRFEPPGVLLDKREQPELFTALEEIARATGQGMPVEVYLVPDVNAFVSQRGGVMGFGSRRIMGLGLPLMQILSRAEMRAVLAHEFGHYHGGDTSLGPWIYKTRAALGRTISALHENASWLKKPFEWYGTLFLRITHAISRRQEFAADLLAAHVVGAEPLRAGLRKLPGAAPLFLPFLNQEVVPALNAGLRPPIVEGFRRFLGSRDVAKWAQAQTEEELQRSTNPYDTHPPLPVRIQALAGQPDGEPREGDEHPAVGLLRDLPALERALLAFLTGRREVESMPEVAWEEMGEKVYVATWRKHAQRFGGQLPPTRFADLVDRASEVESIGQKSAPRDVPRAERPDFGAWTLGVAAALALHRAGWKVHTRPGDALRMSSAAGAELQPFEVVARARRGELKAEDWRRRCEELGIGELELAPI